MDKIQSVANSLSLGLPLILFISASFDSRHRHCRCILPSASRGPARPSSWLLSEEIENCLAVRYGDSDLGKTEKAAPNNSEFSGGKPPPLAPPLVEFDGDAAARRPPARPLTRSWKNSASRSSSRELEHNRCYHCSPETFAVDAFRFLSRPPLLCPVFSLRSVENSEA